MQVVPYKEKDQGKKEQVADMFNNISRKYDLLNHVLSMGIDILWRKRAVRMLKPYTPRIVLDIASGTGDFALETSRIKPDKIYGVDISEGMLEVGRKKVEARNLGHMIEMQLGDSENLHFEDNYFDAVTVAFGVRNYENLKLGLSEMFRVMKPGGHVVIIEFSQPTAFPVKQLYNFYSRAILPRIGKMISKDKAAYEYLPESVSVFPYGQQFLDIMNEVGFTETKSIPLTLGISSIYWGSK
ncbi:MAG: bifunctional demethylmenaquinone methyltransferase/2-methoxy-6-polyprenyl-1,4-benzoquinol methylase UbiE [Cyclobacteriaceae bacterium]|nr:bifunctional demethylmenaquinone methyltransferase/2-methoxy-6-polyprenyl-1,4-benzoquinol methylase UbiE [Cyclobacteriaceae bacterium]